MSFHSIEHVERFVCVRVCNLHCKVVQMATFSACYIARTCTRSGNDTLRNSQPLELRSQNPVGKPRFTGWSLVASCSEGFGLAGGSGGGVGAGKAGRGERAAHAHRPGPVLAQAKLFTMCVNNLHKASR